MNKQILSEDLKIGNWVNLFLGYEGEMNAQYRAIQIKGIMENIAGDFYYLNPVDNTWVLKTQNLEGIPFTEYILQNNKTPFEFNEKTGHWVMNYGRNGNPNHDRILYIGYEGELNIGWYYGIQDPVFDSVIINTFSCVHELQNIVKDITKNKLEIIL